MRRTPAALAAVTALVTGLLTALVTGGPPASASGGWAATYLDPVPGALTPGTPYTIGFWVLQHGTHPFEGELGPTGLQLTAADGTTTFFGGTPLPEAGHYATAVTVPKGTYAIKGVQGLFQPFEVGTLKVPGGIELKPLMPGLVKAIEGLERDYWGAIRPPGFPQGKVRVTLPPRATAAAVATTAAAAVPAVSEAPAAPGKAPAAAAAGEGDGFPPAALALAALGGALLTLVAVRLPRRRRDPPGDETPGRGETIVISG